MSTPFQSFSPGDRIKDTHFKQFIKPISDLEEGKTWFAEDNGVANAFEVTLEPAPDSLSKGMFVNFRAANSVTGACTINVNSLGVVALEKHGNSPLESGDIASGQIVSAMFDGSKFQILYPSRRSIKTAAPKNLLVYSEVQGETALTSVNLPSFDFDPTKKYLLEIRASTRGTTSSVFGDIKVTIENGTDSYPYPSTGRIGLQSIYSWSPRYSRLLPTISGIHDIKVEASLLGSAEVKIYEVNDNLVYADFSPEQVLNVLTPYELQSFTAQPGRRYLLTITGALKTQDKIMASCYLTDGTEVRGIPSPDPTVDFVAGPIYSGEIEVSKLLTDLDGIYSVWTRSAEAGGVNVEIRDIT